MKLKAIFMPDLAFSGEEGSLTFVYKKSSGHFEMEVDNDIRYPLDLIIDDDNWLFFKTELINEEDERLRYGVVSKISVDELQELIKLL